MVSYKHIKADDRIVIETLLSEGFKPARIARRIGVHRSTIGRELKRGGIKPKPAAAKTITKPKILSIDGRSLRSTDLGDVRRDAQAKYTKALAEQARAQKYYYAGPAHKLAGARRSLANQQRTKIVQGSSSLVEEYVLHGLTQEQWSPEQLSGRLWEFEGIKVSHPTIYKYIYNSSDKLELVKHLRRGGTKYRRRHGTKARVKNQQNRLPSIHDREAVIDDRLRLDDYEGDTVVGLDHKDRLLTYVDRATGECLIGLVIGYDAAKISQQTVKLARANKVNFGTITYDRGTEFMAYEATQRRTKSRVYFADAYSSWQRGSNENLSGLIRQYYPKRYDFKDLTQKQVKQVQAKLNNRPRKRYNYRTPIEQRAYLLNLQNVALS